MKSCLNDLGNDMNRETWLNQMAEMMRPRFEELGFPLPKFRVSIGFTSAGKVSNIGGECWNSGNSADKSFEIFISPIIDEAVQVAAVLWHELTHAAVGFDQKHKGDFAKVMLAIGMLRPMTDSKPGPEFISYIQPFLTELGALPHAKLSWGHAVRPRLVGENAEDGEDGDGEELGGSSNAKPKQKTRLLKVLCSECGYTARVSQKWLDKGAPHCPEHGPMAADVSGQEDES
jgi:hypothetical protein